MSEKMRPCPFCGKEPKAIRCPDGSFEIGCRYWNEENSGELWCAASPLIGVMHEKVAVEKWQDAFCWRKLDAKDARIAELEKAAEIMWEALNKNADGAHEEDIGGPKSCPDWRDLHDAS